MSQRYQKDIPNRDQLRKMQLQGLRLGIEPAITCRFQTHVSVYIYSGYRDLWGNWALWACLHKASIENCHPHNLRITCSQAISRGKLIENLPRLCNTLKVCWETLRNNTNFRRQNKNWHWHSETKPKSTAPRPSDDMLRMFLLSQSQVSFV